MNDYNYNYDDDNGEARTGKRTRTRQLVSNPMAWAWSKIPMRHNVAGSDTSEDTFDTSPSRRGDCSLGNDVMEHAPRPDVYWLVIYRVDGDYHPRGQ